MQKVSEIRESVAEFVKIMASEGKVAITWDHEADNGRLVNLILGLANDLIPARPNTDYIRVQALKELDRIDPDRILADDQEKIFNSIQAMVHFAEKMLMDKTAMMTTFTAKARGLSGNKDS